MRALLPFLLALLMPFLLVPDRAGAQELSPWDDFKTRFLAPDGRIVDTGNGGISHSEGQGYAMLAAVMAGDRAAFDMIWTWTRTNMRRKDDVLFAWRYQPGQDNPVADQNNATDGDIFIAWALMRGAALWGVPAYDAAAAEIRKALRDKLVVRQGDRWLLMPGLTGFSRSDQGQTDRIVNLSYLVLPAFLDFAAAAPGEDWDRLHADSLTLLLDARFGRHGLPPDWLLVTADGRLAPAAGWPPRFGYDALRVPLLLAWGRAPAAQFDALLRYFSNFPVDRIPAWTDLATGASSEYAGRRSLQGIAGLVTGQRNVQHETPAADDDYYTAIVGLLVGAAWSDLHNR